MGGVELMKYGKPQLFFELGTYSRHILDIIPYIYEINPSYKLYLRAPGFGGNISRPILYAI